MLKRSIVPAILILALCSFVVAANIGHLASPVPGATINTATYNLTAVLDSNTYQINNATFYYKNTSSDDWVLIGVSTNDSAAQISFNYSWNTTALQDLNSMIFNVTFRNESSANIILNSNISAGVDLNNGIPVAYFISSTTPNAKEYRAGEPFVFGSIGNTTIGVKNCTITANSFTQRITAAGGACALTSYTSADFSMKGGNTYEINLTVIDGNGNSSVPISRNLSIIALGGGPSVLGSAPDTIEDSVDDSQDTAGPSGGPAGVISRTFNAIINFFKNLFTRG